MGEDVSQTFPFREQASRITPEAVGTWHVEVNVFTPLLRNANKLFRSVFVRHSGNPIGLCTLVSLATCKAQLALLEMQTQRRLFHQSDEESFERAQQFTAMYAGTLVLIFMERSAEARKMRLNGVAWEDFDAKTEIHSGVVYAFDTSEGDTDDDTGCAEFRVTADMYTAYLKEFLKRVIATYEKATEHATRGYPYQAVDDSAIAADQFVENITSIAAFAEPVRGPDYGQFLMGLNEFAARSRVSIRRICSRVIKRHIVTRTWV